MRIYRGVSTYIWNDDKFPFASDDCQLVWFHTFTNPLSSPIGLFRASISGLAEDKNRNGKWPLRRYRKAFEEALRQGFVKYDSKALLVSFPKYFSPLNHCNHPQSPNVVTSWGERYHDLPQSPLKHECYHALKGLIEGKGEAFMKAFLEAFGQGLPKDMSKDSPNTDSLFLNPDNGLLITKPEGEGDPPQKQAVDNNHGKGKRAIRDDDGPTEKHLAFAKSLGIDPGPEWGKFKNYCLAHDKRYANFEAAFRNWLARSDEMKGERRVLQRL